MKFSDCLREGKSAIVDGQEVFIGDYVSFKADIEQGGQIIGITGSGSRTELRLQAGRDGFEGGYIGGDMETTVRAIDCWLE